MGTFFLSARARDPLPIFKVFVGRSNGEDRQKIGAKNDAKRGDLVAAVTVKSEKERIGKILEDMPQNELDLSQGLIEEAAWIRVRLRKLRTDIDKNGLFEDFQQSEKLEPYQRERPQAKQYHAFFKDYESAVTRLLERCPPTKRASKLSELMRGV